MVPRLRRYNIRPAGRTYADSDSMIYLKWIQSELATLKMDALYTEVDGDGWVQREIGVCSQGLVIHQLTPSTGRPGWFGLACLPPALC